MNPAIALRVVIDPQGNGSPFNPAFEAMDERETSISFARGSTSSALQPELRLWQPKYENSGIGRWGFGVGVGVGVGGWVGLGGVGVGWGCGGWVVGCWVSL